MQKYNFWGIKTEIDKEIVRDYYILSDEWGCECKHCRNFVEIAKRRMLPKPITDVLKCLDIPPEKATYVCGVYPKDRGFCYQFSYRIAGNILDEEAFKTISEDWGEARCCHEPYPYGAPDFPAPNFDLEFWVVLPWILEDKDYK